MPGYITNVIIYYKTDLYKDIEEYIPNLEKITFQEEIVEFKISCVNISPNGLELEPMELLIADYDNIDAYINDDTFKSINKLSKKINKLDKGLSIIYGSRGTGKTTIINWIASNSSKSVMFIPLSTIDATINNPNFKAHLMKNEGTLLIIDDCEIFNSDMYAKSNTTFANILQMIDGFNSDDLMVNILLSFNLESEEEIDDNLLECNNLIDIIKFDDLKKSKANKLCKLLSIDYKLNSPILLNSLIRQRFEDTKINIGYI
jgi:DNA replication protein DnaC